MRGAASRLLLVLIALLALLPISGCGGRYDGDAIFVGATAPSFGDRDGSLSIDAVLAREAELFAAGAAPLPVGRDGATWFSLALPSPDELLRHGWVRPFTITIKEPRVRHADLFIVSREGVVQRSFDEHDARRLSGKGYRYPLFVLEPADLRQSRFLLRIAAETPPRGLLWLSDFQSFVGNYNLETMVVALVLGIMAAILAYIATLGVFLRTPTNFWLAGSILCSLVVIACSTGFVETLLVPGASTASRLLALSGNFAMLAFFIRFAVSYLRLPPRERAVRRLAYGTSLVLAALALASVLVPAGGMDALYGIAPLVVPPVFAVVMLLAFAAARHDLRRACGFAIACLPFFVPILVHFAVSPAPHFGMNFAIDGAELYGATASAVLFAVLASLDIRRREADLRRQILHNVDRFRALAEIGTDGFWEIDGAGALTFFTGRPAPDASFSVGDAFLDRLAALSSPEFMRPIRETIAAGLPFDDRRLRIGVGERDVWLSLSGRPVPPGGCNRVEGSVFRGLIRDVTAETERETRRAVEQQMFALGQLVGSVAHEINNLIHPIINLTKRLRQRRQAVDDPEGQRLMDLIDLSSKQAAKVVSDLLQTTRGERWNDIDRPISVAVEHAVEAIRPALPANVKVDVLAEEVAEPAVRIGDILQVVGNLLSNAVHAMDGAGHVTVSLAPETGGARLVVSDDGAGMDETVRRRALQPFFTTKVDGRGTGVGLHIVQTIVRDYGGWMALDSTPGLGTAVTIFFPSRKDQHGQHDEALGAGRR